MNLLVQGCFIVNLLVQAPGSIIFLGIVLRLGRVNLHPSGRLHWTRTDKNRTRNVNNKSSNASAQMQKGRGETGALSYLSFDQTWEPQN